jgi:copper/silver efflux system protein
LKKYRPPVVVVKAVPPKATATVKEVDITSDNNSPRQEAGPLSRLIRFFLEQKLLIGLLVLLIMAFGFYYAPFEWELWGIKRNPVPVDALPDIGENQQIVFTRWAGRSPRDVEDQITYPLSTAMLGVAGVKSVRSNSMFGFSSIYVIFEDGVDFYWSRSRVLEKLASMPMGSLPEGVKPSLGPDATGLGQVFWYTLEGRDARGRPAGGWDPGELRSLQDWNVRYALMGVPGVSEVASVGGFVKEYQVDVNPDSMRAFGVTLDDVFKAVRECNVDVGGRTIEVNRVEYLVRGLGLVKKISDIEMAVVKTVNSIPIYVKNVARVSMGPAMRRGALDKGGSEAVGGVVVVRYGANPLETIKLVQKKIDKLAPSLPEKKLSDGRISKVTIVPFYDRTGLIRETLGTLNSALFEEILVTIIVVIIMVVHLRSSVLIAAMLPLAVLMTFIGMKWFKVEASVVALAGIAIAIGTIVDMGIVICENALKHLRAAPENANRLEIVYRSSAEVGGAIFTAIATTVVGFLPVFTMTGREGKLFKPLAFTKTFALGASVFLALLVLPAAIHLLFGRGREKNPGARRPGQLLRKHLLSIVVVFVVAMLLAGHWMPLGLQVGKTLNFLFVAALIGGVLGIFKIYEFFYPKILAVCLKHKLAFLSIPLLLLVSGAFCWSQLGREFMPPLDEGSYLLMPTTGVHASIGEVTDVLRKQDMAIGSLPEVESVVGKIGRVESALDPAPISMIETIVMYRNQYLSDASGRPLKFRFNPDLDDVFKTAAGKIVRGKDGQTIAVRGSFLRKDGKLIPDSSGQPFRQWRPGIKRPDDIWRAIEAAARIPGTTGAPRLQPISTRLAMLQTGMRAPMGIKISGPDLETISKFGLVVEKLLKTGAVKGIKVDTVNAERIVGKPYLEIHWDRPALARYGISVAAAQRIIEVAVGGKRLTTIIEGRERYPVRVRYQRELRDSPEELEKILLSGKSGVQVPLKLLGAVRYRRGPMSIKSENGQLVGYLTFDKDKGQAEVDVVEAAQAFLLRQEKEGALARPAGVEYRFAGSYENELHSRKTLVQVLPLTMAIIFVILFLHFRSVMTTVMVFSAVFVSASGGFIMIWLYGQGHLLELLPFGESIRNIFQAYPVNMSIAVWVGFLALFGIATDDGVVMATYLKQTFKERLPQGREAVRSAALQAGMRRVRPCLMTTATTILALLPVLTSTGRGSDVMLPMAIPVFGGMCIELITTLIVPVLYSAWKERGTSLPRKPGFEAEAKA